VGLRISPIICARFFVLNGRYGGIDEMCIRKNNSSTRIKRICLQNRFSPSIVQEKSRKILDQYRDGKSVGKYGVTYEDETIQRVKKLISEKHEQTYQRKEGHLTGSLDYLIMEVMKTGWVDELIHKTFNRMDLLDLDQGDYRKILNMYYFDSKVMDDDYIMDKMNLARATYYRRKKEAITLFGIMLWNTMIEDCVG